MCIKCWPNYIHMYVYTYTYTHIYVECKILTIIFFFLHIFFLLYIFLLLYISLGFQFFSMSMEFFYESINVKQAHPLIFLIQIMKAPRVEKT
jgi:hypothetical protein